MINGSVLAFICLFVSLKNHANSVLAAANRINWPQFEQIATD
jgi:hypothetical protein